MRANRFRERTGGKTAELSQLPLSVLIGGPRLPDVQIQVAPTDVEGRCGCDEGHEENS